MGRKHLAKKETLLGGWPAVRSHAYKRMDRMTLMGLSLVKLMSLAKLERPLRLEWGRATIQAGKGSRAQETEAAHNLPRDLIVNGKSFWRWVEGLHAHPRIKLQIEYSSAATMTVSRQCNYLDSRWEQRGLHLDWLAYLRECSTDCTGLADVSLGAIVNHARKFQRTCVASLAGTLDSIEARPYFQLNRAEIEPAMGIYEEEVAAYDPWPRLERMWHILHLEKYA